MLYLLIAITLFLALIAYLLSSINGHLEKISASRAIEGEISSLTEKVSEGVAATVEALSSMDIRLQEIDNTLRDIKYVTDVIEKYKLPPPHERDVLDQILIDNEIDSMLNK